MFRTIRRSADRGLDTAAAPSRRCLQTTSIAPSRPAAGSAGVAGLGPISAAAQKRLGWPTSSPPSLSPPPAAAGPSAIAGAGQGRTGGAGAATTGGLPTWSPSALSPPPCSSWTIRDHRCWPGRRCGRRRAAAPPRSDQVNPGEHRGTERSTTRRIRPASQICRDASGMEARRGETASRARCEARQPGQRAGPRETPNSNTMRRLAHNEKKPTAIEDAQLTEH